MNNIRFEETQQFRQKALYLVYFILIALFVLIIYADIQQIILGKPFGDKPAPDFVLVILTLFIPAVFALFWLTELETVVTDEGVFFRWRPFRKRYTQIDWSKVDKAEIVNYGFVGYGYRLTLDGTINNVAGNKGLRLTLKSGKKLIIGTQKPAELEAFLRQINRAQ